MMSDKREAPSSQFVTLVSSVAQLNPAVQPPPVQNCGVTLQKKSLYPNGVLAFFLLPFQKKKKKKISFSHFMSSLALIAKVKGGPDSEGEGEIKRDAVLPTGEASVVRYGGFISSCHLHCNCPLFCHLDYIQQGHANEEEPD